MYLRLFLVFLVIFDVFFFGGGLGIGYYIFMFFENFKLVDFGLKKYSEFFLIFLSSVCCSCFRLLKRVRKCIF